MTVTGGLPLLPLKQAACGRSHHSKGGLGELYAQVGKSQNGRTRQRLPEGIDPLLVSLAYASERFTL